MSQTVACEYCKTPASLALDCRLPPGWFFITAKDDEDGEEDLIFTCSRACSIALWRPGSELRKVMRPEMAAAMEREACAVLCEEYAATYEHDALSSPQRSPILLDRSALARALARRIRERER